MNELNSTEAEDEAGAVRPGGSPLTLNDLRGQIVNRTGVDQPLVTQVLNALEVVVTGALREGRTVHWTGFLKFQPRWRKARAGRNPQTGETVRIASKWVVAVQPLKRLKDRVGERGGD